jgi:hypothetical protein
MPTSGTFAWSLDAGELLAEGWERAGLDPAKLTARHVVSARRSFEFLQLELENRSVRLFHVDRQSFTCTLDDVDVTLPAGTMDVLEAVLRRDGADTPMGRMDREQYHYIPSKTQRGRPHSFYVERNVEPPVMWLWNAPENSTDQVIYYRLARAEDVGALANNVDWPRRYMDAVAAGLGFKLAEKFNKPMAAGCLAGFERALEFARTEDRDRSDTYFTMNHGRGRLR